MEDNDCLKSMACEIAKLSASLAVHKHENERLIKQSNNLFALCYLFLFCFFAVSVVHYFSEL